VLLYQRLSVQLAKDGAGEDRQQGKAGVAVVVEVVVDEGDWKQDHDWSYGRKETVLVMRPKEVRLERVGQFNTSKEARRN